MKRIIPALTLLCLMAAGAFGQSDEQRLGAGPVTIQNRMGRITWFFANSEASSVIFYNIFKENYDKNNELYEYNLKNPSIAEQLFIEMFTALHKDFFDCYNNLEEEHKTVMGFVREDQITELQVYILSIGYSLETKDILFIFIHNTVNDEQALFCNIENF